MGTKSLGWLVDVFSFRVYLQEKCQVSEAYWFVGFLPENEPFYELLQKAGFIVVFKEVTRTGDGKPKGNVDVDLTLYAMMKRDDYDGAIIVTSYGDFGVLVKYLKRSASCEPSCLRTASTRHFFCAKRPDRKWRYSTWMRFKIG